MNGESALLRISILRLVEKSTLSLGMPDTPKWLVHFHFLLPTRSSSFGLRHI
jgi:hypothetical protein